MKASAKNTKHKTKNKNQIVRAIEREGGTYVEEEGPRRGFSLRGWNENLPRKRTTQEELRLGQSFTDMVTANTTTFAATIAGTSHGAHLCRGRGGGSGLRGGGGAATAVAALGLTSSGRTALSPNRD